MKRTTRKNKTRRAAVSRTTALDEDAELRRYFGNACDGPSDIPKRKKAGRRGSQRKKPLTTKANSRTGKS